MNLTPEQWRLLCSIVEVYNEGDTSEFVIQRTHGADSLLFDTGSFPISNSDADFRQLEQEKMITLDCDEAGRMSAKATQRGLDAVAKLGTANLRSSAPRRYDPNAAREEFEKNRREHPGDLPDITLEYFLKSFGEGIADLLHLPEMKSGDQYNRAVEEFFKSKTSELFAIAATWPHQSNALSILRKITKRLEEMKAQAAKIRREWADNSALPTPGEHAEPSRAWPIESTVKGASGGAATSEPEQSGVVPKSEHEQCAKSIQRRAVVMPLLGEKGWSILDWANASNVDFHTSNDYLKGKTDPYRSTRKKLADGLGIPVEKFPR
jgi:hypothetical protein